MGVGAWPCFCKSVCRRTSTLARAWPADGGRTAWQNRSIRRAIRPRSPFAFLRGTSLSRSEPLDAHGTCSVLPVLHSIGELS